MSWLFNWESCYFDEIGLVYEKAEVSDQKEIVAPILRQVEEEALKEARDAFDKLPENEKGKLKADTFDDLTQGEKELIVYQLSQLGLSDIATNFDEKKLTMKLSPSILSATASTLFLVLNKIEKLDGSLNILLGDMKLEIQAPIGGQKGLQKYLILINFLYPWLKPSLVSSNILERGLAERTMGNPQSRQTNAAPPPAELPEQTTKTHPTQQADGQLDQTKPPQQKPGFLSRLFGVKRTSL